MKILKLLVTLAFLTAPTLAAAEPRVSLKKQRLASLMMIDATGAFMGEVLKMSPYNIGPVNAWIVFRGDPTTAIYFETHPLVVLEALSPHGLAAGLFSKGVYFTEEGCTGIPYLLTHSDWGGGIYKLFNLPLLSAQETGLGQIMYVPVDPLEAPTTATVTSTGSWDSSGPRCNDIPTETRLDLTEAMEVPLNFVMPYSIGY
jgi:hypothetical protein